MANSRQSQTCPYCHKPGIPKEVDGVTYYLHENTVQFSETISFGFTYCPSRATQ
jgi:hypothetical protein